LRAAFSCGGFFLTAARAASAFALAAPGSDRLFAAGERGPTPARPTTSFVRRPPPWYTRRRLSVSPYPVTRTDRRHGGGDATVGAAERVGLYGPGDEAGPGAPLTLDHPPGVRWHRWALLALTLLAGCLRFFRIGHPTFWIDEAFTYWRVSGSYEDLIAILRDGGFTPLHYEACWLLGRVTDLSPFHMRLIPAVCGTLMVPAMYFLARQVARRDVALLAAALTCCSAYLLNYSRDAKMYMDAWLFAALHLGCLMWWLRTRRTVAWLGWVAAGLAMGGIHATSLVLLVVQPVMLLTSRNLKWWHAAAFLGGVALVLAGPGGYYAMFNQWTERIEHQGWRRASGLMWVDWFNAGRDGVIDNLRYPASAFLFNWEWPKATEEAKIAPAVLYWFKTLGFALAVLVAAGLFPWHASVSGRARHAGVGAEDARESLPEPWWRGTSWIAAWVVLPLFAFYLVSAKGIVSPLDALPVLRGWLDTPFKLAAVVIVLLAAFSACGATLRQRLGKTGATLSIVAGLLAVCWGVGALVVVRNADSVWVPRYLGVVWPALAIAACACVMRLPGWPLRAAAIALLLGLNLANGVARMTWLTQPPLDRVARDVVAGDGDGAATRTFVSSRQGQIFSPGLLNPEGRYYLLQASGRRVKPDEFLRGNFDFRPEGFEKAFGMAFNIGTAPGAVKAKLDAEPRTSRVILWDQFFTPPAPIGDRDSVLDALGPGWRRVTSEDVLVYKNFSWEWSHAWRRREYVRDQGVARTAPSPP
jgi:4-amino-4-deoxy-L-arabinose transferase-like glycosyltransferase